MWSVLVVKPLLSVQASPSGPGRAPSELPGVIPVFSACLLLLLCTAWITFPSQASQALHKWLGSVRGCAWDTQPMMVPAPP